MQAGRLPIPRPDEVNTFADATAVDQAALQDRAWEMVKEALDCGRMTLPTGKVYPLEADDILKLAQWLASRAARARKLVPLPEEFVKRKKS